jgi:hypothetical protein
MSDTDTSADTIAKNIAAMRPDVNDRQWRFIQAAARPGSTGRSAAIEAGYSANGQSPDTKAAGLLAIGSIRQAVEMVSAVYQRQAVERTLSHQERYSKDWVLEQFAQNVQLGRSMKGQLSSSNRAIEWIAKGVHPSFLDRDRGDGASVQMLGDINFTMVLGTAVDDDADMIEGTAAELPALDEPNALDE